MEIYVSPGTGRVKMEKAVQVFINGIFHSNNGKIIEFFETFRKKKKKSHMRLLINLITISHKKRIQWNIILVAKNA